MRRLVIILLTTLAGVGCLERMELPALEDVTGTFSVGDTTYLQLNPSWGPDDGLVNPVKISISHARHLYVADIGAHDVIVFDRAGNRIDQVQPEFGTLNFDHLGADFKPTDIDIDGRLNLLIINGSNRVYRWNQYWNSLGIDSVATELLIKNSRSGERLWIPAAAIAAVSPSSEWQADLDSSRYAYDSAKIDSLLKPHVIFDMMNPANQAADLFYSAEKTEFSAISTARLDGDYFFYIADSSQNRIMRAALVRNGAVKLGDGRTYFTHTAYFESNVKQAGTGAGSVNLPTGLDVDQFGNLYWAQLGKHIYVHSVLPSSDLSFPSRFELFVDDIMTPAQYFGAMDIAVDARQSIYVANREAQEILVFNGDGSFFKKAGVEQVTRDTSLWVVSDTDSALIDTFYTLEITGLLSDPVSIDVDEAGVIYVVDSAQSSVLRFVLSTNIDEGLINQE